jgi:hypothetical protein
MLKDEQITLQRNTIDIGGNEGSLTIGELPNGISNSSLTWVPVRLYPSNVGGLTPPSFASDEVYPLCAFYDMLSLLVNLPLF